MTHIADKDALRKALTPPLMEMLTTRFPAWGRAGQDYRYAEFVDRIAGIAAEAGCVIPSGKGES